MLPRTAGAEVRIPFEREGHLIRLSVRLNHRIAVPFYFDSGSSGIVLPASYAERLSLEIGPSAPSVTLKTTAGRIFFFSSRRRHTRFDCDWSSDVCSSVLTAEPRHRGPG